MIIKYKDRTILLIYNALYKNISITEFIETFLSLSDEYPRVIIKDFRDLYNVLKHKEELDLSNDEIYDLLEEYLYQYE